MVDFNSFVEGYTEGLAFVCGISALDISDETLADIRYECEDFLTVEVQGLLGGEQGYTSRQAGTDFYLTRNGHGTGFWDRGLRNGEELSTWARVYGESSHDEEVASWMQDNE